MSLTMELSEVMKKYRDCPAVTDRDGKRTLTYGELDRLSERAAYSLRALGITAGDSVAVSMGRSMEYIAAELAILRLGAVVVPLLPDYPQDRVEYIRKDAGVKFIVDEDFFLELARENDGGAFSWRDFPEDTREFILYTSGSTGKPKGIVCRDRAVMAGLSSNLEGGFRDVRPFTYAAQVTMTFAVSVLEYYRTFLLGGHVHILSDEVRSDAGKLEEYFEREKITVAYLPPRMLKLYRNRDKDLKLVFTAGEKVFGIYSPDYRILNEIGMTETLLCYCAFPIDRKYENTPVGKPLGDVTIRLVDERGNDVPPGADGMIVPTGIFPCEYNNLPEESAKTFHIGPDGRVSVYTGDIGRMLPDGNLLYVNRSDWLMKIHGQRVEPGEIECVMREVPGIREAVAKAFEQEDGSMLLCGFYVADSPVGKEEISAALARKLPSYMIPSALVELPGFPLTASGKIDRRAIRRPDLAGQLRAYEKPANAVEESLAHAMEQLLHIPRIGRKDNFLELGGNSLNAVLLAASCGIDGMEPQFIMWGKTPERIAELFGGSNKKAKKPKLTAHVAERVRYPLSLAQRFQHFVCASMGKNMNLYDLIFYYELDGDIDTENLKRAIEEIVLGFPIYRVRVNIAEQWMEIDPAFKVRELSLSVEEFRAFRRERLEERREFTGDPVKEAPLFDAAIIRCGGKKYLFLDMCHMIYDGVSFRLLLEAISAHAEGRGTAREAYSVFDLAVHEENIKDTPFFKEARDFYDGYYQGLDGNLGLFTEKTYDNPIYRRDLLQGVKETDLALFLRRMGISILTLFQGALELTIRKMTGKADFAYLNIYDGRMSEKLQNTRGCLAKGVFVRSSLGREKTVREYLNRLQENYQTLVYYDVVDIPELVGKHPSIPSGICLNFREALGPLRLKGKSLKPNEEYLEELLMAHKPFTAFDLGIDTPPEGTPHTAQVSSAKASPEFIGKFLGIYDGMLRKIMEGATIDECLMGRIL